MKRRNVGYIVLGFAAILGFTIYSFNKALTDLVNSSCSHGHTCPMWDVIDFHTNVSIGLMSLIVIGGLYLIFTKEKEDVSPIKDFSKESFAPILKEATDDEKKILEAILEEKGTMFQGDIVDTTGFSKVKVTRLLDKLEGRGVLERKRRGMANVVVLKHSS